MGTRLVKTQWIHTPAESSQRYVEYAQQIKDSPGLDYGCVMDNDVVPLHAGEIECVIARPGHGKTAWMSYRARRAAQQIVQRGEADKKVVLYFTWETPIEQLEANIQSGNSYTVSDVAWGKVDMDSLKADSMNRVDLPIWIGGKSILDRNSRGPRMNIDQVFENIRSLKEDFGVEPALICLDYLQIIPVEGKHDRASEVAEATYQAKELLIDVGCPGILGIQAKAAVDQKGGMKEPDMGDAFYTSVVDHVADKIFGVVKPVKVANIGDSVTLAGRECTIDDNTFVIKMSKQRMEKGYGKWVVSFDMATMELKDYAEAEFHGGSI